MSRRTVGWLVVVGGAIVAALGLVSGAQTWELTVALILVGAAAVVVGGFMVVRAGRA